MSGLPRSGGTLLSSILNQNPDIYSSAESPLAPMMISLNNQHNIKSSLDSDRSKDIDSVISNTPSLFYQEYDEKYIIDKSFLWLEPAGYSLIEKHIKNDIKIICVVREPLEIFASWNRVAGKNKTPDEIANFFQQDVFNGISNMKRIIAENKQDSILLLEYNNLIDKPKESLEKVYNFLNIEQFDHNFDNIVNPHSHTDSWGIKGQHIVKPSLQKEDYDIKSIFSDKIIDKYSKLNFWEKM